MLLLLFFYDVDDDDDDDDDEDEDDTDDHNIFKNFLLNKEYCIFIHFVSKSFCSRGTN